MVGLEQLSLHAFGPEAVPNELLKLGVAAFAKMCIRDRYKAFGWSYEEIKSSVLAMARTGAEPTEAMGADTPLAVLS